MMQSMPHSMSHSMSHSMHKEASSGMPRVLERGDIFILYQPSAVDELRLAPSDERFYLLLHPRRGQNHRLIMMSKSHPATTDAGKGGSSACYWGVIDEIIRTDRLLQERFVKARGTFHQPNDHALLSMRAAGMGDYTLLQRGDDTHLAYALMEPLPCGHAESALHIPPAATYQIRVKHPDAAAPPEMVQPEMTCVDEHKASLPSNLLRCFEDRHFISADPPQLLDHEGVEFLLLGIDSPPPLDELI